MISLVCFCFILNLQTQTNNVELKLLYWPACEIPYIISLISGIYKTLFLCVFV